MIKKEVFDLGHPFERTRTCLFGPFVHLQTNKRGGYDRALRKITLNPEVIQECTRFGGATQCYGLVLNKKHRTRTLDVFYLFVCDSGLYHWGLCPDPGRH